MSLNPQPPRPSSDRGTINEIYMSVVSRMREITYVNLVQYIDSLENVVIEEVKKIVLSERSLSRAREERRVENLMGAIEKFEKQATERIPEPLRSLRVGRNVTIDDIKESALQSDTEFLANNP